MILKLIKLFEKKFNINNINDNINDKEKILKKKSTNNLPKIKKGKLNNLIDINNNNNNKLNNNDNDVKNKTLKVKSSLNTLNSFLIGNVLIVYKNNKSKIK